MRREKKEGTKPKKTRKLLWFLFFCFLIMLWLRLPQPPAIPNELVGTWRTSDPSYADRSFEIGITIIDFGTGEGAVTTGFIQKVEVSSEGSRTLYTISYVEDGRKEQCAFYYKPGKEKTIYFKNQPSVSWVKDKDS